MRGFPDQEAFHGSSEIYKRADTAIIMAHTEIDDDMEEQIKSDSYKTGIRIAKCRTGFSGKLIGIHEYSLEQRKYSKDYELAVCGENYMKMMNDAPRWAKHMRNNGTEKGTSSNTTPLT